MNKELTNNPFTLLTMPKTSLVNISDICINKNLVEDELFTKKYTKYDSGEENAYMTRVSISKIKPGFYIRKTKRWKYVIDKVSQKDVDNMTNEIRTGYKKALHIYKNQNDKCSYDYVCPDDVVIYKAYRQLKINKVPVIILGNIKELEESALIAKGFLINDKYVQYIYSKKIKNQKFVSLLLGNEKDRNISLELNKLYEYINKLKTDYRIFHLSDNQEIHYHNIVFSILIRTLEFIKSIQLLVDNNLYLPAISTARSLYELSLNFYLCWLCPSFLPFIQLASSASNKELEKIWEDMYKGENKESFMKVMKYQYNLAESVIEKAKISPLGESYYKYFYSSFSKIVHHDFSVHARYKNTLIHGDEVIYDEDLKESLLIMIDTCVTLIYTRVRDEIGLGENRGQTPNGNFSEL